jgi:hypothetical protein
VMRVGSKSFIEVDEEDLQGMVTSHLASYLKYGGQRK